MKLPCLISAARLPLISTDKASHSTISKLGSSPEITKPGVSGAVVGAGVDALPLLLCVTMRVGAGVFDALAVVGLAVTVLSAIILVVVSSSTPAKILPPCLASGVSDALV